MNSTIISGMPITSKKPKAGEIIKESIDFYTALWENWIIQHALKIVDTSVLLMAALLRATSAVLVKVYSSRLSLISNSRREPQG